MKIEAWIGPRNSCVFQPEEIELLSEGGKSVGNAVYFHGRRQEGFFKKGRLRDNSVPGDFQNSIYLSSGLVDLFV